MLAENNLFKTFLKTHQVIDAFQTNVSIQDLVRSPIDIFNNQYHERQSKCYWEIYIQSHHYLL